MPTIVKLLLKAAVSAVLIWLLIRELDMRALAGQLASADPGAVAGAAGLILALAAVQAWRWGVIVRAGGDRLGYPALLNSVLVGLFFNQTLPSSIGGDAVRMWRAYRQGVPAGRAVSGVVLDRVVALVALLLLALMAQPLLTGLLAEPAARWGIPMLVAAGLAGTGLLLALDRMPQPVRRIPGFVRLAAVSGHGRAALLAPAVAGRVLAASLAIHGGVAMAVYLLAQGLALPVSALDCLVLVPPVILVTTLPISIAGWGVREGAMVAAFGLVGVPAADAFALSVLFGLAVLASGLPGGVLWLWTGRRRIGEVPPAPAAPAAR